MKTRSPSPPLLGHMPPLLDQIPQEKKQKVEYVGTTSFDYKEAANDEEWVEPKDVGIISFDNKEAANDSEEEWLDGIFDESTKEERKKYYEALLDSGGTNYKLVKVVKDMSTPMRGSLHFITFEAKVDDKTETFEAKVFRGFPEGKSEFQLDVEFCRVKGR
ncbi:hypothetical protein COLO4_13400 [Corchorus olitorius]|uniref:Cystatin domain-containing protein n=1 Tax=Corchorus olitorius TaxID=93759 RepID=A0A1R3JWL9_9ROSI|nr:hypothetical protein COLO4_13400 [Corchorus olitorius]